MIVTRPHPSVHPFAVTRPAVTDQQDVDAPIPIAGMTPRQGLQRGCPKWRPWRRRSRVQRRSFTPEFKAEIVELCRRGDRSIGQVAKDFDLTETNVRTWVKQAEIDQGERPGSDHRGEGGAHPVAPGEPLASKIDVETLKRATAFFARETR